MTPLDIPKDRLPAHMGKKVHVKGWNWGCVFVYRGTINGVHQLKTPTGRKSYTTTNQLQYTNSNRPKD